MVCRSNIELRGLSWGYVAWWYSLITPVTTGLRRMDRRPVSLAALGSAGFRCSGVAVAGIGAGGGVPLENRVRVVDLQIHAARWYWLIRPPRIGCRRTERKSARSEIGRVTVVSTFGGRWPR